MRHLTVVSALLVAVAIANVAAATGDNESDFEPLIEACADGLSKIETVDEMRELIRLLRLYRQDRQEFPRSMKRCIAEYDSLNDLDKVIDNDETKDVCHPDRVRAIVEYRDGHLKVREKSYGQKRKRMVRHFVRRYALQVALICRQNLVANLQTTDEAFTHVDIEQVLPWRRKLAPDFDRKFDNQTQAFEVRKAVEQTEQLFATITSVDQIVVLMQTSGTSPKSSISDQVWDELNNDNTRSLVDTCRRMSTYYKGAIMSIVSLASAGYAWNGYKLNESAENDDQRQMVSDWLGITVICDPLLSYAPPSAKPVEYHKFDVNRLDNSKPFAIDDKFVDEFAMSKSQKFVDKWGVKMARSASHLINVASSKPSKDGKTNALLSKLSNSILTVSGDRPSKMDKEQKSAWKLMLATIILIAVIVGFLVLVSKLAHVI